MPGGDKLAADLEVGRDTIEAALKQLELSGVLINQGQRRGRLIVLEEADIAERQLRVAILPYEAADRRLDYIVKLEHQLSEAGHHAIFPPKNLLELGMDPKRVANMVRPIQADAWVVIAGSGEILEWFVQSGLPTLAMFGRRQNVTIASVGPSKVQAMIDSTGQLLDLGHRRIVHITKKIRRLPTPGRAERAFLKTLEEYGIHPSDYHLPDWEETVDGFYARLESLFRISPPTAMIIDEIPLFIATQQFLAQKRLRVPEDVSLVCTDYAEIFEWCRPQISHIRWDSQPVARRVVRWVNNLSRGKADFRQVFTPAKFVRGGTIAEVKE